ncbi:MAG: acyltransferase [Fibrobacter sp.]|nr:acyltransferase [Fibrobacter sp.]
MDQNKNTQNKRMTWYEEYIQNRSLLSYYRGLLSRYITHLRYEYFVKIARKNGAKIGVGVVMTKSLAKKLNSNCIIGNHVSIETDLIDTRSPLKIGDNVIIGRDTEIITVSHNINSADWEPKYYGLEIEDYVWLPTKVLVMPSCRKIGRGAVVGSGSVVVKNVEPMTVVSGNPAKEFKKRECVHVDLPVERLLHGDYKIFKETYKRKLHETIISDSK